MKKILKGCFLIFILFVDKCLVSENANSRSKAKPTRDSIRYETIASAMQEAAKITKNLNDNLARMKEIQNLFNNKKGTELLENEFEKLKKEQETLLENSFSSKQPLDPGLQKKLQSSNPELVDELQTTITTDKGLDKGRQAFIPELIKKTDAQPVSKTPITKIKPEEDYQRVSALPVTKIEPQEENDLNKIIEDLKTPTSSQSSSPESFYDITPDDLPSDQTTELYKALENTSLNQEISPENVAQEDSLKAQEEPLPEPAKKEAAALSPSDQSTELDDALSLKTQVKPLAKKRRKKTTDAPPASRSVEELAPEPAIETRTLPPVNPRGGKFNLSSHSQTTNSQDDAGRDVVAVRYRQIRAAAEKLVGQQSKPSNQESELFGSSQQRVLVSTKNSTPSLQKRSY